jgi:hypothetical protein
MKTVWVDILLIFAIVSIPVSYGLRVIYGERWRAWEYEIAAGWGLERPTYDALKIILLVGAGGYMLFRKHHQRKREKSRFYELPK